MSIRLRLTALFSLILAATLIGFSIMLYLTMENSTRVFMENTLALEMTHLIESDAQPTGFVQFPSDAPGSSPTYWQACDSRGNVMGSTDNLRGHILPLSDEGLRRVQDGQTIYEVTRVNEIPMLVYSHPVTMAGGAQGILQVARSIAEQQQAVQTLQTSLLIGGVFTLLIAVAGGWVMAGVSLRPIDQMTRTARMIGTERNFSRRVQYHGPQDEVGRLATTFNTMLFALETAYQQVAQALQAQRSFIADASHELRTPLTTLRGNLALLRREPPISTDDRKAVLGDIVDENERMIRLVNDLMTLARAEYTPSLELEAISLPNFLSDIERQAKNLNPACDFRLTSFPSTQVMASRDMLKQVLLILLDNAFKFTPTQGKVTLYAERHADVVRIYVRDTGIGIATEDVSRIFQRFYRVNHARNGTGYGLGLAIAKALIEQQHGQIHAESEFGQGSTFTITLSVSSQTVSAVHQLSENAQPAKTYVYPKSLLPQPRAE